MPEPLELSVIDTPVCVHRWKLGSPVGGVTSGLCAECGMVRDFTENTSPGTYISRNRRK